MKAITRTRKLLAQIIVESDDDNIDALASEALGILTEEDARTSSRKPSVKRK